MITSTETQDHLSPHVHLWSPSLVALVAHSASTLPCQALGPSPRPQHGQYQTVWPM